MKNDNLYRNEKIFVRVAGITPEEVPVYEKAFKQIAHEFTKPQGSSMSVLCAQLTSPEICTDIALALASCPLRDNQSLYVSLATNSDSNGVHLEPYICEFWKQIGGTLDFSFTVI